MFRPMTSVDRPGRESRAIEHHLRGERGRQRGCVGRRLRLRDTNAAAAVQETIVVIVNSPEGSTSSAHTIAGHAIRRLSASVG